MLFSDKLMMTSFVITRTIANDDVFAIARKVVITINIVITTTVVFTKNICFTSVIVGWQKKEGCH